MLVPGKATGQEFAGLLDTGSRFAEENDRNHRDRQALIDEYTTGRGGDNIRDRFNGTRVSESGIKGINTLINIHGGFAAGTLLGAAGGRGGGTSRGRINRIEEVVDQGGNTVKRKFVNSQDDLLEEASEFMGENADNWIQRKPDFYRSPDGKYEIEISGGHPHMGEGPHIKIMEFDPTKGKKGGFRVIEKIFTESGR